MAMMALFPPFLAARSSDDPDPDEIAVRVPAVLEMLSQLRETAVPPPVGVRIGDRAFFERQYLRWAETSESLDSRRARSKAYVFLGLLGTEQDVDQVNIRAFLRDVKGLYDPESRSICFISGLSRDEIEETLLHESVHVLQDHQWGMESFLGRARGRSLDRQYALKALLEGEATALTLEALLASEGRSLARMPDLSRLERTHRIIEEGRRRVSGNPVLPDLSRSFHYVRGAAFVQEVLRIKGWKGMDKVWEDPPESTEQILHPERYLRQRDRPTVIRIRGLEMNVLRGWVRIWEDTLGEFGLGLVLGRSLPETEAQAACRGWDGDRFLLFERGNRRMMVGYAIFDDEASAEAFWDAYRRRWRDQNPRAVFLRSDEMVDWSVLEETGEEFCLERRGCRVLIIERAPRGKVPSLGEAMWDRRREEAQDLGPWL